MPPLGDLQLSLSPVPDNLILFSDHPDYQAYILYTDIYGGKKPHTQKMKEKN